MYKSMNVRARHRANGLGACGQTSDDSVGTSVIAAIANNPYVSSPAFLAAQAKDVGSTPGGDGNPVLDTLNTYCLQNQQNHIMFGAPLDTQACAGGLPTQNELQSPLVVKALAQTQNQEPPANSTVSAPPSNDPRSALFRNPTVQLLNLTRPGQSFQVGDTWQILISGAPNAPVAASATQNGASMGTTNYGNTDPSGNFSKTGVMDASTVGTWSEQWSVGGVPAPSLSFTVAAASSTPVLNTPVSAPKDIIQPSGLNSPSLAGLPLWVVLAAAGVAALFLFGSSR